MTLSNNAKRDIDRADKGKIEFSFKQLTRYWEKDRWLGLNNSYKQDPKSKIISQSGQNSFNHKHLEEYIAASTITHLIDSWSYLGRAIECEVRGDKDSSTHLAYYAELRSMMSFMATEGIGVFDRKHIVITNNNPSCISINGAGTHTFLWELLEYWTTKPASSSKLLNIINPGNIALSDWLNTFSSGYTMPTYLATHWLKSWGLDIQRISKDRSSRNIVSYNPSGFRSCETNLSRALDLVDEFWRLFEPFGNRYFSTIDRYLLRISLRLIFKQRYGINWNENLTKFEAEINRLQHNVAPSELSEDAWFDFLTGKTSLVEPEIFKLASGTDDESHVDHSKQVLARATLLLRLATGACFEIIKNIHSDDVVKMRYFWDKLCADRGISDNSVDNYNDLWVDITDALDHLNSWKNSQADVNRSELLKNLGSHLFTIGSTEIIPVWTFGESTSS